MEFLRSCAERFYYRLFPGEVRYPVRRKATDIFGLTFIPSIEPTYSDDDDFILGRPGGVDAEVTQRNLNKLKEIFLQKRDSCRFILEIGICRNEKDSFTYVFLNHKKKETIYLGVDIGDKSFLDNCESNIHTLRTDSANQAIVRNKIRDLGVSGIDILFIDGWHSINMVVNDWKYADLLGDKGVVMMHDTNCHPGPVCVFDAVDENLFRKEKFFVNDRDWGMAALHRIS